MNPPLILTRELVEEMDVLSEIVNVNISSCVYDLVNFGKKYPTSYSD